MPAHDHLGAVELDEMAERVADGTELQSPFEAVAQDFGAGIT